MLRYSPFLLLASCGIFGRSAADEAALARYQRNAALYYEGGRFDQALDQARRGLEIEPEDYKLSVIRAWCLLRKSRVEPRVFPDALAEFERVMRMRAENRHGPQALLGYALARQKLGIHERTLAEGRREEIERGALEPDRVAAARNEMENHREAAARHFREAERLLGRLVQRGDLLLEAHYHLMQTSALRGDYVATLEHGRAFLDRVRAEQERHQKNIERTYVVAFEEDQRRLLQQLIDRELEVRAFLANVHYDHRRYDLAVAELDRVLSMDPTRTNDYYHRALSLEALGRLDEARRDYEKFLATTRLPPGSRQVRHAVQAVARLDGKGAASASERRGH